MRADQEADLGLMTSTNELPAVERPRKAPRTEVGAEIATSSSSAPRNIDLVRSSSSRSIVHTVSAESATSLKGASSQTQFFSLSDVRYLPAKKQHLELRL